MEKVKAQLLVVMAVAVAVVEVGARMRE